MLDWFTTFQCGAVDAPGAGLQDCYKYQLQADETLWTDGGAARFERNTRVNIWLISGIGIKQTYALLPGETILLGAEYLAAGVALAATAMLAF